MTIISNTRYLQEHNVNYQMITTFFGSYQKLTIQPLYNPSQRSGWELTCVVGLQIKDQVSLLRGYHFLRDSPMLFAPDNYYITFTTL